MYENVGIECLSPESSNHSLPKRNGLSFQMYGEKKQYLFTLWLLHLQSTKGNKIGPLKQHAINFCPKFGR